MSGVDSAALAKALSAVAAGQAEQEAALDVDKYVTVHPDGTITQTLEYPFTQTVDKGQGAREEKVTSVTYARPKGRHMSAMTRAPKDGEVEVIEGILVDLAGIRPEVLANKFDSNDYMRALAAFGRFFPKPPPPAMPPN